MTFPGQPPDDPSSRKSKEKTAALFSLLLLIPAPSVGVLFGMVLMPGSALGQGVFLFSKIWILLLPAFWFFLVEKKRVSRCRTGNGGYRTGLLSGLAISGFIVSIYLLFAGRLIDASVIRAMASGTGLDRPAVYLAGAAYWVCVNSVLEEYVWRWFVVRQCQRLMRAPAAIIVSALGFMLHHVLAMQVYFSWPVTSACGAGILFGGLLWSWMFIRYGTIWPGWVSHALVDAAVFGIGYVLIFG